MGHRYWFGVPIAAPDLPIPPGSLASGQLISSAEDMAHYLIAHLNGGRYGDVRIVSEAGARELHRGEAEYIAMGISSGRYAMGWFDAGAGENRVVSHTGNVADFSGYMALLPEQKKGVVLLVNADHFGLPPILAEVGAGAAALLAGGQPPPIQLGFIPWTMRLLPLVPLLQIAAPSTPGSYSAAGAGSRRFARAGDASGGSISFFRWSRIWDWRRSWRPSCPAACSDICDSTCPTLPGSA